jgi:Na+/melibiose symporter-like transporter
MIAEAEPTTTALGGKPYTAPRGQIWSWGVGRLAEGGLIMTYQQAMNIYTVGFGLSPVIVSWCMMLPRLADGILDPIIGHWSDDTRTRWGRRKPFLIGGAGCGAILLALMWWAILPDICDVDELESGQRREGLFTAVMGFVAKLEISLSVVLVGYMVEIAGLNTKLVHQPEQVLSRLFYLAVITAIVFAFLTLVMTLLFPMTEEYMDQVRRELDELRLVRAAVDEPVNNVMEDLTPGPCSPIVLCREN